jgi:chemotaxis protein histidine kinase CheA
MDFIHLPRVLHDLETRLSAFRQTENGPDLEAIGATLAQCDLRQARLRDLAIIEEALGTDFLRQRGRIAITGEQASKLESLAKQLMERESYGLDSAALDLLRELRIIRRVNFKSLLGGCTKTALQLAERLGKAIYPFSIEGDDVLVDPDRFGNFARTLIHVFRNAVDHGIETPDERAAMEKDDVGSISCAIARNGGEIVLTVRDDGRGLDPNLLRARSGALSLLDSREVRWMDDTAALDLVFEESFSTRETVSDISGRGMGLSAVRAALRELGGRVQIETKAGEGTAFRFILKAEDGERETEGM